MVCKKCEGKMVFQPELFDPGRGQYVCGYGYRSGRVFEEKRPAGVGTRQAANQQMIQADSIEKVEEKIYRMFTSPEIHSINELKGIRPRTQFRTEEAYQRQFDKIRKKLKQFAKDEERWRNLNWKKGTPWPGYQGRDS